MKALLIGIFLGWCAIGFGGPIQNMHSIVAKKRTGGGGGGPVTFSTLTLLTSTSNVASFATSSITPTSNRLVLCAVANTKTSAADVPTSVTGCGLTWVQIDTTAWDTSTAKRITLFRAMGASPSAGAVTADFNAVAQSGCYISVVEFGGVDTGGTNGSSAVVQAVVATGASTSVTVSLAALTGGSNAVYMAAANRTNPFGGTAAGTAVENYDSGYTGPNQGFSDIYDLATTDNTPATTIVSDNWAAIAVEIKVSP